MTKRFSLLILFCIITMSAFIFTIGCSPAKDTDTEKGHEVSKDVSANEKPDVSRSEGATTGVNVANVKMGEENIEMQSENPLMPGVAQNTPSEIILASKLLGEHTKNKPILTHEQHIKTHNIACNECHHVYEDGKNVWHSGMPVQKCESCHNEATVKNEKKLPEDVQKKNLKIAFHNNCRSCHKEIKKDDPESKAPVTCSQCHAKK